MLHQFAIRTLLCALTLLALAACSGGGMSDSQVEQSLVAFIGEIDQSYTSAGAPPLDDPALFLEWKVDLETQHLGIVDKYIAANPYPSEVLQHMTDMRDGLSTGITIQAAWIKDGTTQDTKLTAESQALNDAAMKSTFAESQLRIAAGL